MYLVRHASVSWMIVFVFAWAIACQAHGEIIYKIPTSFGWRLGLPLHLLEQEAVQRDLGLTAEKSYMLSLWRESIESAAKSQIGSIKDKNKRREILAQIQLEPQFELGDILTSDQQNRLHEIDLQLEGLEALSDELVAKTLEFSPDQYFRIRSIHNRMLKEEKDSVKGGRKADHLTFADRDKMLLDVLLPAQQEKFRQMKGAEFDRQGFLPTLRLKDQEFEIWSVIYSSDGKRLASSRQNEIFIWDAEDGRLVSRMKGHGGNITSLCFGPDGKWLISASTDRTVKSWDVSTGDNILSYGERNASFNGRFIPGLGSACYRSVALSPDGKQLVHANGTSISISYGINPLVAPFFGGGELFAGGIMEKVPVWSVAFNADGKRHACGRFDGSVYLLGLGMGKKIVAATDTILSLAFSFDGQQLATASADGTVKTWNATDGNVIASYPLHSKAARCVAFSHDGDLLASAGEDGIVRVVSVLDPSTPRLVLKHGDKATSVAFQPNGNRIATAGSDGIVRVWDGTGREVFALERAK
ncbi:MAG: WD40 repeat domain-containing protein [Pirellulales bacterium]